ncbi:MAG TPA: energy transducer TonB [Anaeromyxobacter sp.]
MGIPVATALGKRDRMWPAVLASLVFHALVVAWAVVRRPPPPIDLNQKPIIAKLVRLGEKRPEEWMPRKDVPPPPPPPAPSPVAAPVPSPSRPAAPTPKAPAKPAAPSQPQASLASILSKVQKQVDDRQRWGDPSGDPSGDSDSGTEGDRYLALVRNALQSAYIVPATISERERMYLKATVVLFLEPNGRVVDYRFETRSGNPAYDGALERAIRAVRLPPPPPEMREQFRKSGFGVNFHL